MAIRLLLADDQELIRTALGMLLDLEDDFDVVASIGRGDEVLPAVEQCCPDVALLDIEMPGLDGIEAAAQIAQVRPSCNVVIVTTFGRPGYLQRAIKAGVKGFVVKDAPAERLGATIRAVMAGRTVVDPALAVAALTFGSSPLTTREAEVLAAARTGASAIEIARILHLSEGTVRNYLSAAIAKTGATNRAGAVARADELGWL